MITKSKKKISSEENDLELRVANLEETLKEIQKHLLLVQKHLKNCIDHQVATSTDIIGLTKYLELITQSLEQKNTLPDLPPIKPPPDDDFWN